MRESNATPDHTPSHEVRLPTRPTLGVEEAGRLIGIGRAAAYAAVRNGELPSIRIGRRLLVPTASLQRMLDAAAGTPQGVSHASPGN